LEPRERGPSQGLAAFNIFKPLYGSAVEALVLEPAGELGFLAVGLLGPGRDPTITGHHEGPSVSSVRVLSDRVYSLWQVLVMRQALSFQTWRKEKILLTLFGRREDLCIRRRAHEQPAKIETRRRSCPASMILHILV
jgi:hypothetical protein